MFCKSYNDLKTLLLGFPGQLIEQPIEQSICVLVMGVSALIKNICKG